MKIRAGGKGKSSGFTSAQDKVQAIEDEVSRELDLEWEQNAQQRIDQEKMDQNIRMFYEKLRGGFNSINVQLKEKRYKPLLILVLPRLGRTSE